MTSDFLLIMCRINCYHKFITILCKCQAKSTNLIKCKQEYFGQCAQKEIKIYSLSHQSYQRSPARDFPKWCKNYLGNRENLAEQPRIAPERQ